MGRRAATTVVVAVLLAAAAAPASGAQLQEVAAFSSPLSIAAPPGDPDRVFVVEQGGTIREVLDGVKQPTPFLDISSLVTSGGERGLLSMAFAPDYATSHRFYVYYTGKPPATAATGDIEVDELTASSPDRADPATRLRVLTIPHFVQANHNGGQLQVGPDGYLYLGTGDGGGGGDTQGNGQNLTVSNPSANAAPLLAKILRIQPLAAGGYAVPPDNPFAGAAAPVWMLGLRNPWRWSFDRSTGDMIIGDVGQDAYEEIDYVPAASPGVVGGRGANFGWNLREGLHAFSATNETAGPGFATDPVIEKTHNPDGWLAIIGGYVVRDPGLPELDGTYVFGDNVKGQLWGATLSALSGATSARDLHLAVPGLSGMGEDACGRVYVALLGGDVQRLVNDSGGYACTAASLVPPVTAPAPAPAPSVPVPVPAPIAVDRTAPRLRVTYAIRQHAVALARVLVHAGCDERCVLTASATLHIGRLSRHLATAKTVITAGSQVSVRLKLSRTLRTAVARALRRHVHPRVAVHVTVVDQAGNARAAAFNVKLTG